MSTDASTRPSPTTPDASPEVDSGRGSGLGARIEHALRPWRRANPGARRLVIAGTTITLFFLVLAVFADVIAPFGQAQYCADEYFDPTVGGSGVCVIPPDVSDAIREDLDAQLAAGELSEEEHGELSRRPGENPPRFAPAPEYPMGTTKDRFDVLSRVILGARLAFAVVAFSTAFAMLIGVPLGLFSGYIGGKFDRVMVLLMDTIYAFPSLLLAILIAFALRVRLENAGIEAPFLPAAIAVGTVYIPQYFRVIRNHTLSVKEEPYVEAARSLGANKRTIVFRYIFFNVVSSIPVLFTLNAADAVLTMAGLGFLGYGVNFPTAEWGLDVNLGLADSVAGFWWTAFWPGVAITLLVTGLSLMGEGLNDIINPLLRVKGYRGKVKSAREAVQLAGTSGELRDPGEGSDPAADTTPSTGEGHV